MVRATILNWVLYLTIGQRWLSALANPVARQEPSSTGTDTFTSGAFTPVPTTAVIQPTPTSTADDSIPWPSVTIYPAANGYAPVRVIGRNPTGASDRFIGIPFALPPVQSLRFVPPQPVIYNTTIDASHFRPACAQTVYRRHQTYQNLAGEYGTSEDCLYLNIIRPTGGRVRNNTDLPVLVFFPGGNFYGGAASNYDGTRFGQIGVEMGMPMIQVTVSYRLGVLGWPAGPEAASSSAGNLGLRDGIMALEWVRDHIWAFGGDSTKITAAGQSAGAAIISLLYLRPDFELFRSALTMSASPSLFNLGPTADVNGLAWGEFAATAGCSSENFGQNSTIREGETSMECLRRIDVETLMEAQSSTIDRYGPFALFGPTVDGDLVRAAPSSILASGSFSNRPILIGAVKDEGTTFVLPNMTNSEFQAMVRNVPSSPRSDGIVDEVMNLYPDVPDDGAPYGSGNDTFGFPSTFKRAASFYGDAFFQAPRRLFLDSLTYFGVEDVWAYHFEQPMPERLRIPPYIGTGHHSDTIWSYGQILAPLQNYTENDQALSLQMIRYFVNFIHHSNPNPLPLTDTAVEGAGPGATVGNSFVRGNLTEWRRYAASLRTGEGQVGEMIRLLEGDVQMIRDDFRIQQTDYLRSQAEAFGY